MRGPIILITGGPAFDKRLCAESRMLNKTYVSAIVAAGGVPIMDLYEDAIEDYVALADGCVFTGTQGFTPDPELSLHPYQVERIVREHKLMHAFMDSGKPVLGICQGMQQLNTACGGDLHIDFRLEDGVEHNMTAHTIRTVEGSFIHRMFGDELLVNSFHGVKVKTLGADLQATAFSPDGVIEAFEHKTRPVYAFQWHPERMRGDFPDPPNGPDTDHLFREFIKMCEGEGA